MYNELMNILTELAVIPGLVIIVYIYGKDKVEKEPLNLILRLIIFGTLSGVVAGTLEQVEMAFLPSFQQGSLAYALTMAFGVAGLCEELVKFLALKIGSWNHPSFNYRFDGIVYGVSVAVGFAVLENLNYVFTYGFQTAIVRAFTAVPLHAFCGAMMGILYSYAKKASIDGHSLTSTWYQIAAYTIPLLIHGIYDTLAMLRSQAASMMLMAFVIYMFLKVTRMVNKMSAQDNQGGFY